MRPRGAVDAQRHARQVPAHLVLERGRAAQGQTCRLSDAPCACCESGANVVLARGCAARRGAIRLAQGRGRRRERVPRVVRQRGGASAKQAPARVVAAVGSAAAEPELLMA